MIRTAIVGGGMAGLTLARLLRAHGHDPVVLERAPAGAHVPRGFMLGYQGYEAFGQLGILDRLRAAGRDVAVGPDGVPTGIAVDYGIVMSTLPPGPSVTTPTTRSPSRSSSTTDSPWATGTSSAMVLITMP